MRWLPETEAAQALDVTGSTLRTRAQRDPGIRRWEDTGKGRHGGRWLYAVPESEADEDALGMSSPPNLASAAAMARDRLTQVGGDLFFDASSGKYLARNKPGGALVNQLPGRVDRIVAALVNPDAVAAAFDERGMGAANYEVPRLELPPPPGDDAPTLVHISTRDLHVGEPGDPQDYHDEIMARIERCASWHARAYGRIDRWLVTIGSDWCTIDTAGRTTTKGTAIPGAHHPEVVRRWAERLAVDAIDMLRQIAPVTAIQEQGNHDTITSGALASVCFAWFRGCDDVEVLRPELNDQTRDVRTYYQWHDIMIAGHHGHVTSPTQMPRIMAAERPRMWGETRHRYALLGHRHHSKRWPAGDHGGAEIIQTRSPSKETDYEARLGFVGDPPGLEAFAFQAGRGLVGIRRA